MTENTAVEPDAPDATVTEHPASREIMAQGRLTVETAQSWWSGPQLAALESIGLAEVPKEDLLAFLHLCQRSELDPFAREIYLIGRKDRTAPSGMKYTAQTGIDGYRHIAERTGEYAGREGPWWCGPDGQWTDVWLSDEPPAAAKVNVFRSNRPMPFTAVAVYREFVPMTAVWENNRKVGEKPSGLWNKMPGHMLAKCAEALALRQAFPRQASGIYVTEEMHAADSVEKDTEMAEAQKGFVEARAALAATGLVATGPGEPATMEQTAPGDVVAGEVEPDRDALWAELEVQAAVLDKTVRQLTTRWVKANRKNIDDATAAELAVLVESNRPRVAEKVKEAVEVVAAETVIPEVDDDPDPDTLPLAATPDTTEPHPYQDWSGKCLICTEPQDDPRHN